MQIRGVLGLVGVVGAVGVPAAVLAGGATSLTTTIALRGASSTVGIVLDPVRAILVGLVVLVATLVAGYVSENLRGQRGVARFLLLQVLLAVALVATIAAPSLLQLALAWTATTVATAGLVGHARSTTARAASRRVLLALLVGDLAVWAAVVVAVIATGTTDLDVPLGPVVPVLLVAAGLVRSAQVPAHRWLQETTEAPSPVSALLHAGVVNAVGVVALVAWPLVAGSTPARGLVLVAGAATVGVAWATGRVRPDVKGRLVSSTAAQMGYLAVVVGLGLPAAVLVHVVGHGLWKAALFLGAGSAVERVRRAGAAVAAPSSRARGAVATIAVLVVVAVGASPAPGEPLTASPASLLLLAAAALTSAVAAAAAYGGGGRGALVPTAAVVALGAAYVVVVRAAESALAAYLPVAAPAWGEPGALLSLVIVVVLSVLTVLAWRVDRTAAAGGRPSLVRRAAALTLPPRPLHRVRLRATPDAGPALGRDDVDATVALVSDVVAPLWPLHAFVASNPLAGMERLHVRDALEVAGSTWGSRAGIDADLFRLAIAEGAVDREALARVCASVAPGPDLLAASPLRTRAELVQALLVRADADPALVPAVAARLEEHGRWVRDAEPVRTPGERAAASDRRAADVDRRARDLVSMHAARSLGDPGWPGPQGIWDAVRSDDLDAHLGVRGARDLVVSWPADPVTALGQLASVVDAMGAEVVPVLTRLVARDPGFVAHLQWRRRVGIDVDHARIADLLAARLALDVVVARTAPEPSRAPAVDDELARSVAVLVEAMQLDLAATTDTVLLDLADLADAVILAGPEMLRLQVWEESYRVPLLDGIARQAEALVDADGERMRPAAQVITCIDVRSEPLRRALEARGPWETFGAAGFFGLPLRHVASSGSVSDRLPALLLPDREVAETGSCPSTGRALRSAEQAAHGPDHVAGAPFALADAAGWVAGPWAVLRTAAPRVADRLARGWRRLQQPRSSALELEAGDALPLGFTVDELVDRAQAFLAVIGLDRPAPLVVLLGHGAHVTNQPHVAAYDCGACGGNPGDVSARAMAQVLNDPRVRAGLADRGVVVPRETVFVGALHGTTDGTVDVLGGVPDASASLLAALLSDLREALRETTARGQSQRAADWAQARPEWGLARNAALVIGPRALTSRLDLDGRVFLHSYRHDLDTDGASLEFLLTAPMVVAQWINTQYWTSTVDPERFGAGDKTLHDVLCRDDFSASRLTGVMVGTRGDLRLGLPWQAVSQHAPVDGAWPALPHHEPLRLLVVVHATVEAIDSVLGRREEAARLVAGEWVALVAVDPSSGRLSRRDPQGGWVELEHSDEVGGRPHADEPASR